MLQEGTNRFSDMGRRRLVSPALAGRSEVNAGENQRQLGRAHFHRYCTVRDRGKLERAFLKSLEARITLPSYLGRYKNASSPLGGRLEMDRRFMLSGGTAFRNDEIGMAALEAKIASLGPFA